MRDLIISGPVHITFRGPYGFNDLLFSLTHKGQSLIRAHSKDSSTRTPTMPQGYPVRENHPRSSKAWRSPLEENMNSLLRTAPEQEQLFVNSCMYLMEWKRTQCCWWLQTVGHYNTWPSPSGFRRKYNRKIGITDHKFTLVISN